MKLFEQQCGITRSFFNRGKLVAYCLSISFKGAYFHPSTWHNGVYTKPEYGKVRFMTRQGKVHARVSVNWAEEFNCLLRVDLEL